jgi:tetratricopeptide (TPR) repeat protein
MIDWDRRKRGAFYERYRAGVSNSGRKRKFITRVIIAVITGAAIVVTGFLAGCGRKTMVIAAAAEAPAALPAKVTSYRLNLRSGPGKNNKSVKTLKQGDILTVTGGAQNGWLPVEYGETKGWVSADMVTAKAGALPAGGSAAESGFHATHKIATNDGTNLRLRSAPSVRGNIITSLDNGSLVQVLETGASFVDSDGYRGNWTQVLTPQGTAGWCFGAYLDPLAQTGNTVQSAALSEGDYAIRPVPAGAYAAVQQEKKKEWQMALFIFIAAVTAAAAAVIIAAVWKKQRIKDLKRAADSYIKSGKVNFDNGNFDKAIEDYSEAIRLDTKNAKAYTSRGNAYLLKGTGNPDFYNKAFDDYSKAIDLDPLDAWAYYGRGRAYCGKKDFDRALDDYSRAIKLDPNEANFYLFRGMAHSNKADQACRSRIETYKKARMYKHAIAVRKLLDAGYEDAIKDLKRAADIEKDDTQIQQALEAHRESLDASHQTSNATANLAKSSAVMGLDADMANSGVACYNKGNYSQAIEYFDEAIYLNPKDAALFFARGQAYGKKGNYYKASEDFKDAARLAPDNAVYQKAISMAEALEAQECLEKIRASQESLEKIRAGNGSGLSL